MDAPPLLTTVEIAAVLRVHPKHVYRLLRRGLPGRRLGGEWRFVEAEVLAWMQSRTREPAAVTPVEAPRSVAPLLVANGDVAVERLLTELERAGVGMIGLVPGDSGTGFERLRRGEVLLAGVHGSREVEPGYVRIDLVEREVGLASPRKRPPSLAAVPELRIASRPGTAPMRRYLEGVLEHVGASPQRTLRRATSYASHCELVLALLRGEADVGMTTRGWAERGNLSFRPITSETYGLLVRTESMANATVIRLCDALQSAAVRKALAGLPGYDTAPLGRLRLSCASASGT